jgi:O-antigen/teichoic acid export membrane protein
LNKKFSFVNLYSNFKGLFSIAFADIITAITSALFWLYLSTLLSVESYGELFYLLAIANMVSTISLLGSKNTLLVCIPKNIKLDSALFLLVLVFSAISSLIILLVYSNIELSIYVLGAAVFGLGITHILGKKLYSDYIKYLLIQKISMVFLSLALYQFIEGISGIIFGISISFFVYIPLIIKTFKVNKINFSLLKPNFQFLIYSYFIELIAVSGRHVDKFVIVPLLGFTMMGNYQLGMQFISLFQLLPLIVLKYTIPIDAVGNSSKHLKIFMILFSAGLTVSIIFLAPVLIPLFFQKFIYVINIVQILSLSLVPFTISTMYVSKFYAKNDSKTVTISVLIFVLSFLLAVILFNDDLDVNKISTIYVVSSILSVLFFFTLELKKQF